MTSQPKESSRKPSPSFIRQAKQALILTFVFVFIVSSVMFTTTYNHEPTLNPLQGSAFEGKMQGLAREYYEKLAGSGNASGGSGNGSLSNARVDNNGVAVIQLKDQIQITTVKQPGGDTSEVEFPGMPDPCAKPRRQTGVEDILCMKRPTLLSSFKNPCWYEDDQLRCLPYFHLIGTCKSGTSDFFKRLYLHPSIVPNKGIFGKEIWYWSWKRFELKKRGHMLNVGMTLREFTFQFKSEEIEKHVDSNGYHSFVTGHGDPMDIWDRFHWPKTPQNDPNAEEPLWTTPYAIRHINPDVKLILMVRDPINRLYSHYFHSGIGTSAGSFHKHIVETLAAWRKCLQEHTLRSCIYRPDNRRLLKTPIYASMYAVHLEEWLKVFPRSQLFIFRNEDYSKDMKHTFKNLFNYLNISEADDSLLTQMEKLPHFYATQKKKQAGAMKDETKKLLVDFFTPFNKKLAEMLADDKYLWKDTSFS